MLIKSVSGTRTVTGVAMCHVEDQEYVEVNYKAFRVNDADNTMIHRIEISRIMLLWENFCLPPVNYT